METLVAILQAIVVFVAGLATRVLIVVAVAAALLLPVLLVIGAIRALRWAWRRGHAGVQTR